MYHLSLLRVVIVVCISAITTWTYAKELGGYFLADDLGFLHEAAGRAQRRQLLPQFLDIFTSRIPTEVGVVYRPVSVASFIVDYLVWNVDARGWHCTNLVLHLVNALLLGGLVEQLIGGPRTLCSLAAGGAAALLFALRPCSPEAVVWLAARHDQLALLGMLIAFVSYLQAGGRWGGYYLLALGGFLFAMGSKESGITVPGGLMALHVAGAIPWAQKVGEPDWRLQAHRVITSVGPFVLVLLVYFAWRLFLFGSPVNFYLQAAPIDLHDPAWRAVKLSALRFFLAPSLTPTVLATSVLVVTGVQILLGGVAAWHSPPARRVWIFGGCWLMVTLLALLPYLAIAPTGEGARLLYIPGAALAVSCATPLAAFSRRLERTPEEDKGWQWASVGVVGVAILFASSVLLLSPLLQPWREAGQSMRELPPAIAARAETVPENGFAILLIPDRFGGAFFGRNGQGALMEPPVQPRSVWDRVLVVTYPLSRDPARLSGICGSIRRLEYWCWQVTARRFAPLSPPDYPPETWAAVWQALLREAGCVTEVR